MRRYPRADALAAWVLAVAIAGCAVVERQQAPAAAVYDLGPVVAEPVNALPIHGTFVVPETRAPAHLESADMIYRLLYEDSARPQAYARSRWAAEPSALFTDRLRARLAAASDGVVTPGYSARVDYMLRAELDEFSQFFDAPGQSRVVVLARATLLSGVERKLLGQRVFSVERPAAPDAPGAARALSEATEALIDELLRWTARTVGDQPAAASAKRARR
jgi:cholesterol transport system auxiliary component